MICFKFFAHWAPQFPRQERQWHVCWTPSHERSSQLPPRFRPSSPRTTLHLALLSPWEIFPGSDPPPWSGDTAPGQGAPDLAIAPRGDPEPLLFIKDLNVYASNSPLTCRVFLQRCLWMQILRDGGFWDLEGEKPFLEPWPPAHTLEWPTGCFCTNIRKS